MGAPIVLATHVVEDLAAFCRGRVAYAAHIHGERVDFRDVDYRGDVTIVLGSEATGVSEAVIRACAKTIYIPMAAGWDCLNVAASSAVLLAEVQRQRRR
jgi:tRNA G18 (ribose-2'-O)-methylase SpoU